MQRRETHFERLQNDIFFSDENRASKPQEAITGTRSHTDAKIAEIVRNCGPSSLRRFRDSKNESQLKFWARFGVTQSTGSRFEAGYPIPQSVVKLVQLYADGKITDVDLLG